MTVEEMLERMSAEEFKRWQIFYSIEPFGEARADIRFGHMLFPIYQLMRQYMGLSPLEITDFTVDYWKVDEPSPWETMKAQMKAFTIAQQKAYADAAAGKVTRKLRKK